MSKVPGPCFANWQKTPLACCLDHKKTLGGQRFGVYIGGSFYVGYRSVKLRKLMEKLAKVLNFGQSKLA